MKFLKKHWQRFLLSAAFIFIITIAGLILWAGSEIASPSRRSLMDYHQEYLNNPAAHGVVISRFTASDGTPTLICTPDPSGHLADRGMKIRQQLTERGLQLAPPGKILGTLVLIHGRKGRKEDYLPIAERLCAVGFRCIIPDLPAHGEHPASITTYGVSEAGLPAKILDEASRKFTFLPEPAGLLGISMGGSVSVHAAALHDAPWKALVVIASFDSFPAVIQDQASRYIGSTLGSLWAKGTDIIYHRKSGIHLADIQPHRHAASITIPTLIAHGTDDNVTAISSGKRLYESFSAASSRRWIEIPKADHENFLITSYPIYADIAEWMLLNVVAEQ